MNGKPRDQISTDISAGRPALSRDADALTLRVADLMAVDEQEALWRKLDAWAAESPSWASWMHDPAAYLADFDPATVAAIATWLEGVLPGLVERGRSRGWEI